MNENTNKTKGFILIVEDRFEEKIGKFKDSLSNEGYNIILAKTLEEAKQEMNDLLKSNNIDGVILDFSFPINSEDLSDFSNGEPNGITFLKNFKFQLNNKKIPIIINTTADENFKKKYLKPIESSLEMPLYVVDHECNPLANLSPHSTKEIINLFNARNQLRNIQPDKRWNKNGGSFIRDNNGKIIGYR